MIARVTPIRGSLQWQWRSDALFAVFLALLVSGATIIVMMCLLMLADLTENWRGGAFGQIVLQRAEIGQTNKSEFMSDWNINLPARQSTMMLRR